MNPKYQCILNEESQACTREQICGMENNSATINWKIDNSDGNSLNNWIIDLGLHCQPQIMIAMLFYVGFIGLLFGCYLLNPLGDIWGRGITFRLSLLLQIVANTLLIFSTHLYSHYLALFLYGFASSGRVSSGHIWLLENLPESQQAKFTVIIRLADVIIPLIGAFLFIQNFIDWRSLFSFTLTLSVLCFLGSFAIPESPKYLISVNREADAKKSMKRIAKFNGTYDQIEWSSITCDEPIYSIKHSQRKDVWKRKRTKRNIIAMMTNLFIAVFIYCSLNYILLFQDGDIYINTYFSALAEVLGILVLGGLYNTIGIKGSLFTFWIAIMIVNTQVYYLQSNTQIILFANKFAIAAIYTAIYIINVQIFDPQIRCSVFGYCNILGRTSAIFVPFFSQFQQTLPFMILFISVVLGITATSLLRIKYKTSKYLE